MTTTTKPTRTRQEIDRELMDKIGRLSDEMLLSSILTIHGNDDGSVEVMIVRSRLLREYEIRNGEEQVDVLMDSLGM